MTLYLITGGKLRRKIGCAENKPFARRRGAIRNPQPAWSERQVYVGSQTPNDDTALYVQHAIGRVLLGKTGSALLKCD